MEKFFSFKRFVTFGLGLGMFMSAASGFAQTTGITTSGATATLTLSNGGTISGTGQVLTIDAVGNGNVVIKDSTSVQGNLSATQTISTSGLVQGQNVTATNNLKAANGQFNVDGDTGNVKTSGTLTVNKTLSAAGGSFEVTSTGRTKANQGLDVNGAGGLTVGTEFKVTPAGAVTSNGINNSGKTITNVSNGVAGTDAANVNQLNAAVGPLTGSMSGQSLNFQSGSSSAQITSLTESGTTATEFTLKVAQRVQDNVNQTVSTLVGNNTVGKANNSVQYNQAGTGAITTTGKVTAGSLEVTGATKTNGIDNSGQKITGVGDGAVNSTSKEAVNGSQLNTTNTNIGTLSGASAGVSDAGAVTPTAPIATGTGSVTTQLGNVVTSTAAAVNNTNARVTGVESRTFALETKTQNITATAGQTKVTGSLEVTGAAKTNGITNTGNIATDTITATSGTITNGSRRVNPDGSVYFESNAIANGSDVMAEASKRKLEITRVDGRIDTTNARVTTEVARLDDVKADKTAVADEVSRLDGRIDTTNTNLANETTIRRDEVARVDGRISDTNARVTAEVARLDDVKADKTAVATEVARVDGRIDAEIQDRIKGDADTLRSANTYTDNAVGALSNTVTREVTRVDGRIDTEAKIRADADIAINKRIDTEAKTRGDADIAINKRIDVESTERKADVSNLNNRVDQEIVDRVEGDRQTLESANAHTNNQVSNERDRALAAEAGLNRHINGLGAMTMAANAVAQTANPGDKKTSVGVGVGSYGGETAVAIGVTHTRHIEVEMSSEKRPVMVRYGATLSKSRASRTGFGVGASFSW